MVGCKGGSASLTDVFHAGLELFSGVLIPTNPDVAASSYGSLDYYALNFDTLVTCTTPYCFSERKTSMSFDFVCFTGESNDCSVLSNGGKQLVSVFTTGSRLLVHNSCFAAPGLL